MKPVPKTPTWTYMPLFEKIAHFKNHITQDYAPYVDKIEVKAIVPTLSEKIQCAPIVRILKSPDDLHESDLQKPHLLKAAHGSGWNIPLHDKTANDLPTLRETLTSWNRIYVGNNEPHYAFLKPRFFIEEYVDGTPNATVYLIRCISGQPVTISVKKGQKQNSYDLFWKPLKSPELPPIEKPKDLEELLEAARALAKPFEFVRVDLYKTNEGLFFSEFTFTPAGGNPYFSLTKERELGKLWLP